MLSKENIRNKFSLSLSFFLKAIKLPLVFLLLGLVCKTFLWFPQLHDLVKNRFHFLLDILGNFLLLFSLILFIYLLVWQVLTNYQDYLRQKQSIIPLRVISIVKSSWIIIFLFLIANIIISSLDLPSNYDAVIRNITVVMVIAIVAWTLLQILSMIEDIAYLRYTSSTRQLPAGNLYTKIHIIRNVAATIIITLSIAASLMVFDKVRDIGVSILASAGFLTAIFALAAQKSLSSILVGIQIALASPIKMGDYISIENQTGLIEEITLTYVIIRLANAQRLFIPIQYFIDKSFQNWSKADDGVSGNMKVFVQYHAPIDKIRDKLKAIVREEKLWDERKCDLVVGELQENNIQLTITLSAESLSYLDQLMQRVKEKLLHYLSTEFKNCLPVNYYVVKPD